MLPPPLKYLLLLKNYRKMTNPCNPTPSLSPSSWTLLHLCIINFGIAFLQVPHPSQRQWESCLTKCYPRDAVIDFIFPKALLSNECLRFTCQSFYSSESDVCHYLFKFNKTWQPGCRWSRTCWHRRCSPSSPIPSHPSTYSCEDDLSIEDLIKSI